MKRIFCALASLLVFLPAISSGEKYQSPEERIRRHLRMDAGVPLDIWNVRSKVLTIVRIGQPWASVEKAMSAYGLGMTSEAQPTPCGPGDNGLLCIFKADATDPGGKRMYWIEFFFKGDIKNQVLEDVAVTLFQGKSRKSTSKFYASE